MNFFKKKKNVSRPSNPPDELSPKCFEKKSISDELFLLFFLQKCRIWQNGFSGARYVVLAVVDFSCWVVPPQSIHKRESSVRNEGHRAAVQPTSRSFCPTESSRCCFAIHGQFLLSTVLDQWLFIILCLTCFLERENVRSNTLLFLSSSKAYANAAYVVWRVGYSLCAAGATRAPVVVLARPPS